MKPFGILFIALTTLNFLTSCASDNDDRFFRRSTGGENQIPFGGRSKTTRRRTIAPTSKSIH